MWKCNGIFRDVICNARMILGHSVYKKQMNIAELSSEFFNSCLEKSLGCCIQINQPLKILIGLGSNRRKTKILEKPKTLFHPCCRQQRLVVFCCFPFRIPKVKSGNKVMFKHLFMDYFTAKIDEKLCSRHKMPIFAVNS